MRAVLIDALQKQYEAEIAAADATIKLLLENSVGVSEHLNHQKELDCQLHKIASAEEKLQVLKDYEIPKAVIQCHLNQKNKDAIYGRMSRRLPKSGQKLMVVNLKERRKRQKGEKNNGRNAIYREGQKNH